MTLWVDADGCPAAIKGLILRAAGRLKIMTVFVANKYISIPQSSYISSRRIGTNPEAVDMHITESAQMGDIVVTQDIPLAAAFITKGVIVISTRGALFTKENIGERLAIRNLLQNLRDEGNITPGPKEFSQKDGRRFAGTLDRVLTSLSKTETT